MGAAAYVSLITGETMEKAYEAAVADAYHEHGSGGYSGTIKESSGIFLARGPLLEWDAEYAAGQLIYGPTRGVEKWGPVGAVPIAEPVKPRDIKVVVDFAGTDPEDRFKIVRDAAMAKAKPNEGIYRISDGIQTSNKIRVQTNVPKSTTVRKFVVRDQWRNPVGSFDSQAAARAFAEQEIRTSRGEALTVHGELVRSNGEPLLTVTRHTTKSLWEYTVTLATPSAGTPKRWAVAGIYSS